MSELEPVQERSRYIVEAVDSALQVLELVSHSPGSTLVELASQVGQNKSRTMRFLVTLEAHGLVRKDKAGEFYLATRALILGDQAREQMGQLAIIQPILDGLRDRTSETVQYRVLDGLQTVCLAKANSLLDIRVHTDTGRPRELYVGSSKSILAFGASELLEKLLAQPMKSYTNNTLVNAENLKQQLNDIRQNGYSVSRGERIEGAVAIGVPIYNADGSVNSCLSLLGPEFRIKTKIEELAHILMAAAREVQPYRS